MILAGAVQFTPQEIAIVLGFILLAAVAYGLLAGTLLGVAFSRRSAHRRRAFFGGLTLGAVIGFAIWHLLNESVGSAAVLGLVPSNVWAAVLLTRRQPPVPPVPPVAPGSLPHGYQAPYGR